MNRKLSFYALVVLMTCIVLTACSGAEKSAGMVLESAGSVVRSGGDKMFIDPAATPIPEQHR